MTSRQSIDILTEPPPIDADARLAYGREPLQFGDLRLPKGVGPHPLVVVIHGGYWQAIYNLTHAGHICEDLAEHGIATWNVEYRRLGDPGGGWTGTFDDVESSIAFLEELGRRYPLDLDRVVAIGHSAGGHLALWAAARAKLALRGVVSLAGVVDLHETARRGDDRGLITRLLSGSPEESPLRWFEASPRMRLPLGIRQVLVCGTADPHFEPNERYYAEAQRAGDPVEFVALEGAGHFELVDPLSNEWPRIRGKIAELL